MDAKPLNTGLLGFILVGLLLSFPSGAAIELQSHTVRLPSARIETASVECYRERADLDIVIGSPLDKRTPSMRITLKNYRSVEENADRNKELSFKINDPSVGSARIQTPRQTWHVHPAAAANGHCLISLLRNGAKNLELGLECQDLVPDSNGLTLEQKSQQTLQAWLSSPLRCSIEDP